MSEEQVFDRTAYNKKYYEDNKEKHKKYYSEKILCEGCGARHTRSTKSNHLKSKKHAEGMKYLQEMKKKETNDDYEKLERKYKNMKKLVSKLIKE